MVITLREGGETSLILALLFSSLKGARHVAYRAAAWCGFAVALGLSILAGVFLHDLGELGALFEGTLAWIGAGFIASLAVQLHMNAVDYRSRLKELRQSAGAEEASWATAIAIGSFAFVSVIREGLETAVFLSNGAALRGQSGWLGAGVGLSLAAAFGISIYLGFRKLDVRAFMRTTEILLFALVISLFLSGLHEFAEAGLVSIPRSIELFQLTWIDGGLFLQLLLCAGPFLYVALAGSPPRHYVPAVGTALLLAVVPLSLGWGARAWEHVQLSAPDRARAAEAESAREERIGEMLAALGALQREIRAGNVAAAREAWVRARGRFVQVEPLIARVDGELAEELNGEPGEAAGFHGVEGALFLEGAPWARERRAGEALLASTGELMARSRVAAGKAAFLTLDPTTLRAAWSAHRWTLLGRADGQESGASQTGMTEWASTLEAIDADLGGGGFYTTPVREALGSAVAQAAGGPSFGEHAGETRASPARLHVPVRLEGPDRVWEQVDREALRRAVNETFARIDRGPSAAPQPAGK